MQRIYTLLLLAFLAFGARAQHLQELSLHFAQKTWQSQYTNPALMSNSRVNVGLPVVSSFMIGVANTAFSLDELVKDSVITDSSSSTIVPYYNIDGIVGQLNKNDFIGIGNSIDLFSFGIRPIKALQIGLDVSVNTRAQLFYPSALVKFAWFGNKSTLGEPQNFAPRFEFTNYAQVALRGAFALPGEKITVGAALKYLQGSANISTSDQHDQMTVTTLDESNYPILVNADYVLNFSGPGINQFDSISQFVDTLDQEMIVKGLKSFGNSGFAGDIGVTFKPIKKLTLAASIIDFGFINWREGRNMALQGNYRFDGINVSQMVFGDTLDKQVLIDSLKSSFSFTETKSSYRTALATKIYVSGEYQVLKKLRMGGLFFGEQYKGNFNPAFGINANIDLKNWFSAGAMVCYRNRSISNLGMNLAIKGGPVQFYLMSDNLFTVFNPFGAKNFNLRAGLNVRIGKFAE